MNRRVLTTTASFIVAYAAALFANAIHLGNLFVEWFVPEHSDSFVRPALYRLARLLADYVGASYGLTLFAATMLVPLGALVRMVARSRVRAMFPDPLDRMRAFAARPVASAALTATPALWWLAVSLRMLTRRNEPSDIMLLVMAMPIGIVFATQLRLARRGLGALLAPTRPAGESTEAATADGFTFDAVAVTKETIGAVAVMAVLSLVMVAFAWTLPTSTLMHDRAFLAALVTYAALAVGGTLLFRRASRIEVGLDGVFVSGSARRRFVSFADIDGARVRGSTIELTRGDRAVLRLQLHGEDAVRRFALADRIRAAIATAAAQRSEPAVDFVKSAKPDALERAAGGASSYRETAPTREKLWEVLESPAVDAAGRKAAAVALAKESTVAERARLRVAASSVAEPTVRARLEELLDESEPEEAPRLRAL